MRRISCVVAVCCGLLVVAAMVVSSGSSGVVRIQAAEQNGRSGDEPSCRVRHLRGTFSVLATGTVVTAPQGSGIQPGPFATVGTLRIDRDGTAILDATRSFNGQIIPEVGLPGTLTLRDDCTGTAAFMGGRTFDLIALDDHNEMQWIQTNPGTVVTIVMKRM